MDNEVADCYQPIVGADAVWVYCRIARNAHGAWIVSPKRRDGDTRLALREIAEWCGKSVDTVWRCLQVLEHVGLLQAVHTVKGSGRYALVDVKALVLQEGGEYDVRMGCFQLPAQRVAELTVRVRELRLKLARKKAAAGAGTAVKVAAQSVAQSDRLGDSLFSALDAKCDRSVALSDKTVALGIHPTNKQDCKTAKQTTPPYPPQAGDGADETEKQDGASKTKSSTASVEGDSISSGNVRELRNGRDCPRDCPTADRKSVPQLRNALTGDGKDGAAHGARNDPQRNSGHGPNGSVRPSGEGRAAAIERAVAQVRSALSVSNERKCKLLRGVIAMAAEKGEEPPTIALDIIAAVREQAVEYVAGRLKFPYGLTKFLGEGIWRDRNLWAWDIEAMRLQAAARVGSVR